MTVLAPFLALLLAALVAASAVNTARLSRW